VISSPYRAPAAPAGRLPEYEQRLAVGRRAQTFLRMLGIEIAFSREGRMGTRMSTSAEDTVSTVSIVGAARTNGSGRDHPGLAGTQNE
jgi:hypothetical protein